MLLILPLLLLLFTGVVELGLLAAGDQKVEEAAARGCRLASRGGNQEEVEEVVRKALGAYAGSEAEVVIRREPFGRDGRSASGQQAVTVIVTVPAETVAPDLLTHIGIRLRDEELIGHAVMVVE